ncbi:40S ribosomal protein S15 [Iris pallida]|uniref:40S ribosomal protein S15 n=1 Tax=Iris pallida TaxID=29817 RepID=A0AAX6ICR7_IRIPA|nr:40S ribosomal protein S15 [Iris pallida]
MSPTPKLDEADPYVRELLSSGRPSSSLQSPPIITGPHRPLLQRPLPPPPHGGIRPFFLVFDPKKKKRIHLPEPVRTRPSRHDHHS